MYCTFTISNLSLSLSTSLKRYICRYMMITEHALHAVLKGSSVPSRCGPTRWWMLRWQVAQLERLSKAGTQRQEQGGGGPDTPGGITGAQDQAQWSWRPDSLRAWMACTHTDMIFQHIF